MKKITGVVACCIAVCTFAAAAAFANIESWYFRGPDGCSEYIVERTRTDRGRDSIDDSVGRSQLHNCAEKHRGPISQSG